MCFVVYSVKPRATEKGRTVRQECPPWDCYSLYRVLLLTGLMNEWVLIATCKQLVWSLFSSPPPYVSAPDVNVPRKWRKNEEEIRPFPPSLRSDPNLIVRLLPVHLSSTQPVLLSLSLVFRPWDQDKTEGGGCFCSGRELCREGWHKRGSFIYILFVVSRLFPDLGWIPGEVASKKDVEYRTVSGGRDIKPG